MLHYAQIYLSKLLKNTAVVAYLRTRQPDILQELEGNVRIEARRLGASNGSLDVSSLSAI